MYGIGTDIDEEYLSFSRQRIENVLKSNTEETPLNIADNFFTFE
jgi:hypothetical protein